MIEEKLENFRKVYIGSGKKNFAPPDILAQLPAQNRPYAYKLKALIVILAVVIFSGSAFGVSQAASPGTSLYPLKLASDEILAKVTGRQELKIEKRAQEVIESTNTSQKQQEEALKEFQKALDETEEEAKKSGKSEAFRQTLDSQENKFKKAQEKNPSHHLEEAIKRTKNAKGEVQGKKDNKSQSDEDEEENHDNEDRQDGQKDKD